MPPLSDDGKMPPAAATFVKLLCADIDASTTFYEKLGFTIDARDGAFVRLKWGEDARLYLVKTPALVKLEGRRGVGVLVCFTAIEPPVDVVTARAEALGAQMDGPRNQPWHTRELVVTDPDGYRINFVQPN